MHGLLLGRDPISVIVADYAQTIKKSVNTTLTAYWTHSNPINAIVRGLHTIKKGNVCLGNRHQNHIKKCMKSQAIDVLSPLIPPSGITNFEDLFNWVYNTLHSNGIIKRPCLWVYDIALRIGQGMAPVIEPKDYVYLYAGANTGAKMLGGITIKNNKAPLLSFPPILRKEGATHIENIMCDYSH